MPRAGSLPLAYRAIAALEAQERNAAGHAPGLSAADRVALEAWPGWGPLATVFEPAEVTPTAHDQADASTAGEWVRVANRLDDLVSPEDLAAGAAVCDTAFYTPAPVVDAMFRLLGDTGFTGGQILEPGCGAGRLMSRTPAHMDVTWTGVEIDPVAARIAALLHPDATIINAPMQKTTFRTGQFDAVIGNVPFSQANVFDPAYDSGPLHEYFLLRSLDAVRPGGFVVAVTSRHTMDAISGLKRVLNLADLHTAIRLPTAAFASEGTTVIADILVLQRRTEDAAPTGWDNARANTKIVEQTTHTWSGTRVSKVTVPTRFTVTSAPAKAEDGNSSSACRGVRTAEVNRYWETHPDHVAGQMRATGYEQAPLAVDSSGPAADITRAADAAARWLGWAQRPATGSGTPLFEGIALADAEGRPEGSFHLTDGSTMRVVDGDLTPVRATAELKALIGLRDAATDLLSAEADLDRPDDHLAPLREKTRRLYEAYVDRWGPINRGNLHVGKPDPDTGIPALSWRRPSMGGFRRDPGYVTVLSLEDYDETTGEAQPAPILLRRVNTRPTPVTRVETPGDALSVTLAETGYVDLDRVASLLGLPGPDATVAALGDLVYADPGQKPTRGTSGGAVWVTARDYLCGDVRAKHAAAVAAAAQDRAFARNVTALETVLPRDLDEHDITVALGAPWVGSADIEAFLKEVLGQRARVTHTPRVGVWEVDAGWVKPEAEVQVTYGTSKFSPYTLVEYALNAKSPVVWDEIWDPVNRSTRRTRNQAETLAAQEKQQALADRFSAWIWEDTARSTRVKADYNQRFNSTVPRRHDGSHLTFPGIAEGIRLWPWQHDIVDRILCTPRTLCGHPVGAGKTRSMLAAAWTLRRFGLASKPLIVVPNHLLEQIGREAQQTFPLGRFLIATKEDLAGDQRRLFAARCATGDWDAVVMTHQGFTSLPVDPEIEAQWLETQKADLRAHLQALGGDNSRGAKQIARNVRSLEGRLESLRHNTGDEKTIRFEHLGVDFLAIDEAHLFRRLPVATKAEGFSLGASKRATDLQMKIETLAMRDPDRPHVAFFTGTPWSNTLAETYVWQRYLQPDRLAATGVDHFDAWAASFVRYDTRVEITPDGGGFRLQRRPAVIQNAPELFTMLGEVADILTPEAIGLERPAATVHNVALDPTDTQQAYVRHLMERAEAIRKGEANGTDNMLSVCSSGRAMALDPHLVAARSVASSKDISKSTTSGVSWKSGNTRNTDPGAEWTACDAVSPKVAAAADKITRIYVGTRHRCYGTHPTLGALQLVLCDQGTPKPGDAQTYGRLRTALIERGVPADRIRWVHEATTDKARASLFAACRDGEVAVLMGSTDKVGIGTNIQTRLVAVHHVDAPWRPADLEQRDGRALRPGNLNEHVDIYRYVTTGTFDAYMWQTLERKARFITQARAIIGGTWDVPGAATGRGGTREIEDMGDMVLSYGEVKALATGNPLLLEHATVAAEVKRLRTLQAMHRRDLADLRARAEESAVLAEALQVDLDVLDAAQAVMDDAGDTRAAERSPSTMEALERFADGLRRNKLYPVVWRGLELDPATGMYVQPKRTGPVEIRVRLHHREAGSITLLRKEVRQHPATAAAVVADRLDEWAVAIPVRMRRLHHSIGKARADATQSRRVAEQATFPAAGELRVAEQRLAIIDAQIAEQATGGNAQNAA